MTKDSHYQYQLDIEGLAGEPEADAVSYDDGGSFLGTHDTNLFDENQGRLGGQLRDEANGLPYDNSTYTGYEDLREIDVSQRRGDGEGNQDVYRRHALSSAKFTVTDPLTGTEKPMTTDQWIRREELRRKVTTLPVGVVPKPSVIELPKAGQTDIETASQDVA